MPASYQLTVVNESDLDYPAFTVFASVAAGAGFGYLLDRWLGTQPWCLVGGLVLAGSEDWPRGRFMPVDALTVAIGLGYTVFSEYANTTLRGTWAYADLMPRLPWIGTGLSPVLQWLVVPTLALGWARRAETSGQRASTPNPAPTRSRSP